MRGFGVAGLVSIVLFVLVVTLWECVGEAIGYASLVGVTAFYAVATYYLVTETKQQAEESRRALVRPCIQVWTVLSPEDMSIANRPHIPARWLVRLINIGLGPATDIRVQLVQKGKDPTQTVYPLGDKELRWAHLSPHQWMVQSEGSVEGLFQWDIYTEPDTEIRRYKILGRCWDAFGCEVPIALFFDSQGTILKEKEW